MLQGTGAPLGRQTETVRILLSHVERVEEKAGTEAETDEYASREAVARPSARPLVRAFQGAEARGTLA